MARKFDDNFLEQENTNQKKVIRSSFNKKELVVDLNSSDLDIFKGICPNELISYKDCKNNYFNNLSINNMSSSQHIYANIVDEKKDFCKKIEMVLIECLKKSGKAIYK